MVDTSSMSEFVAPVAGGAGKGFPVARMYDYKTTETVHHTNYFEQPATLDFILDKLGVP